MTCTISAFLPRLPAGLGLSRSRGPHLYQPAPRESKFILQDAERAFRVIPETLEGFCPKSPREHCEFIGKRVSNRMDGHKASTLREMPGVHHGMQRWPRAARIRELAIIQVVNSPIMIAVALRTLARSRSEEHTSELQSL